MSECPRYLKEYESIWNENHKKAELEWFKDAKYGMFLHYGLYSLLHDNEWVMRNRPIPVANYEKLADHFTAHHFDADAITDLALEAGMKYITITACHHEGFCLWDCDAEPFNSVKASAGHRDLIRELSEACDRKGLGFFAYYTFMMNWRHPYFVDQNTLPAAYPHDPATEPGYLYRKPEDFRHYINYILRVMDDLLDKYKITGIWLDLISAWYGLGDAFIPIEEIYAHLRERHPDVLISWKDGATGTEDFASPENDYLASLEEVREEFGDEGAARAARGIWGNRGKHNEVCSTIQNGTWGYSPLYGNRSAGELYDLLGHTAEQNCNLLLNAGIMADGSIHPTHAQILRQIGDRIRRDGYPTRGCVEKCGSAATAR